MKTRSGGATRFELAICTVLVAVLATTLLGRLLDYRVESERAAAHQVAGALRSALAARAAQLAGDAAALAALSQDNPLKLLSRVPANYIGEYYSPDVLTLRKGSWFFDRSDKSVNYLFSRDTISHQKSNLLRFKVEFTRSPQTNRTDRVEGVAQGLALSEVEANSPHRHSAPPPRPVVRTTFYTERSQ